MAELHKAATVRRARIKCTCVKCGKDINEAELYIRVNPRFLPVSCYHIDCAPSKREITEMIVEERKEFLRRTGEFDVNE